MSVLATSVFSTEAVVRKQASDKASTRSAWAPLIVHKLADVVHVGSLDRLKVDRRQCGVQIVAGKRVGVVLQSPGSGRAKHACAEFTNQVVHERPGRMPGQVCCFHRSSERNAVKERYAEPGSGTSRFAKENLHP